ncbi:AAA family ATPase [Micromonospora globbae]|nr:AAA family ATPase [Micromonospora globbae]
MTDLEFFRPRSLADLVNEYGEDLQKPPFIIPGILHNVSTVVYGQPKHGKSVWVCGMVKALVSGDSEFMGQPIHHDREWRVSFILSDGGAEREVVRDMAAMGLESKHHTSVLTYPGMPFTPEQWQVVADRVISDGCNLVVLDNFISLIEGNPNYTQDVNDWWNAAVRPFTLYGIPVIVVAHSSDKFAPGGEKGKTPAASFALTARTRWSVHVWRCGKDLETLAFTGKGQGHTDWEYWSNRDYGFTPAEKPVAGKPEKKDEKKSEKKKRDFEATRDMVRDWVLANGQGVSNKSEVARMVKTALNLDQTEVTIRQRLGDGGYGVHYAGNGKWYRKDSE